MKKFISVCHYFYNSILSHRFIYRLSIITIIITTIIESQVTGNDIIDLLKPMLNVHESHYEKTVEIIMH